MSFIDQGAGAVTTLLRMMPVSYSAIEQSTTVTSERGKCILCVANSEFMPPWVSEKVRGSGNTRNSGTGLQVVFELLCKWQPGYRHRVIDAPGGDCSTAEIPQVFVRGPQRSRTGCDQGIRDELSQSVAQRRDEKSAVCVSSHQRA